MKSLKICLAAASLYAAAASSAVAQDKEITLCWAARDPANALVELSKDFTASSGIKMNFELVPWQNFADRFLNELNSGGKLCDLMIGDSQWIGGGATYGHYIKLNDFFAKEGISMDDFLPATIYAYSTWPKGTPNYYALPAMGDTLGWVYRKDWFARPEILAAFKAEYGRDLAPPKTRTELKQAMPPIAVAIPIFPMYRELGLSDTRAGMILLCTAVNISLAVWLLKGFVDEIPREY